MTKQKTIKNHYITEFINSGMGKEEAEETFNRKLDGYIDKNGWCRAYFNYCDVIPHDKRKNSWRPISLRGIETNNGWTSILSEKDLPKGIESKKILFRTKDGITTTYFSEDIIEEIPNHFLRYSHWRIKEDIPDPIF